MEDKLRRYIESIFEDTSPTKKSIELKEEMLQNLEDKYRDLLLEGKTPEAAFNIAVAGIGDVSVLLRQLESGYYSEPEMERYEASRRRSAMLTAIAVMMYILSILPLMFLPVVGVPAFITMIAAATGILIYNNMTKPKNFHEDAGTLVEEFREWQSETQDFRQMRGAISSALWSLIVVMYFIISFTTSAWHVTWIIFILGGVIESFINIFFAIKNKRR